MQQYLHLLDTVLKNGTQKNDRTGVGTISYFGYQMRFNLQEGFPLLTTKKIHFKSVVHELLWFIKGATNIEYLKNNGVSIWNEWADENGELGPIYGYQWRSWPTASNQHIDQLQMVIDSLKKNPDSRRHIVSAWNVGSIDEMKLPPCHILFQFYVENGNLSCQMYQRSADIFLGVPFNIASYALLTHLVAQVTNLRAKELIITLGDAHIYSNHIEQVKTQLQRTPKTLPSIYITPGITSIDDFTYNDIRLDNYEAHPHIKADIAV